MSVVVDQLTKVYGEQVAVNAVSFEARAGEIVGFLGPNGAGKSTTMKMLTGYIPPTGGTASVGGYDIVAQSRDVRKQVGYLPEHNPLYPDMYVREYLHFAAGVSGMRKGVKDRIEAMIEQTGLTMESRKKIGQLSKGYRQRVGLAQALLHDPSVLILDEPTTGLDPNQLSDIRQLIRQLGREKTVILSTHIMQEVQAMCDRVLIIDKGNLVANDTTQSLTQQLQGQYILELETLKPVQESLLRQIAGVKEVELIGTSHYRMFVHQGRDIREELFRLLVKHDQVILTLQRSSRNLEDVFRSLTQKQED